MSEARYHVRFVDDASGEELGLMLTESPQLGFTRRLVNPYAAKGSSGRTEDSDLTEWSVISQRDWRGGRGQEERETGTAFNDARGLETRIRGQLTLGPLEQNPVGDLPKYEPGNVTWYQIGAEGSGARAMGFTAPAGGITCDVVYLYLRRTGNMGTYTVRLCQDNGGEPGTVITDEGIGESYVAGPGIGTWVEVEWSAGGQALAGGTPYHITIHEAASDQVLYWGADAAGGYGGGSAHRYLSGSWNNVTEDMYFRVNDSELAERPVAFVRYEDDWYVAAGNTVYEWDETNSEWDTSEGTGQGITAMEVWGGYLWAARGSGNYLRRYNGTVWADAPGNVYAKLLKAGGGYLHRTGGESANRHKLYWTVDGSTWSSALEVGAGDHVITGLAWYRDMIVCATEVRLWGVAAEFAYPLLDWSSQEWGENGEGMLVWSRTGCLYIPLMFGLYRWNGDVMTAVGPEQRMALPADRAARISMLLGTSNWLYAAMDAGASAVSSILAYNGMGGWHQVYQADQAGDRIRAVGFETIHSPNRLWLGLAKETRYLLLPDYSDDPWQWSGYEFNSSGEIDLPWIGGDLLEVVKDLHEVVIRGEGVGSAQPVSVYYEVDRSGQWTLLGTAVESPREALEFAASSFTAKTVGSGSTRTTVELGGGTDTSDMAAEDWCRINSEVRQVASIVDSDTFTLETALAAAPASGDAVYASLPAGREFRLRLTLETNDKTETPRLKAVFVRYQNNVLDRFVYTLTVRVEEGLRDLAGNSYPHAAADVRVSLDEWAKRVTAFTLYDPDGVGHAVKVIGGGEGGWKRTGGALPVRYGSVYSLNLVEVG